MVTTTATGAADSVADRVTGLVAPVGDAEALAEAILKLADDPATRRAMGHRARQRVLASFQQTIIWNHLADLYRELLRERHLEAPEPAPRGSAEGSR